jgi:hypothetical protein
MKNEMLEAIDEIALRAMLCLAKEKNTKSRLKGVRNIKELGKIRFLITNLYERDIERMLKGREGEMYPIKF